MRNEKYVYALFYKGKLIAVFSDLPLLIKTQYHYMWATKTLRKDYKRFTYKLNTMGGCL